MKKNLQQYFFSGQGNPLLSGKFQRKKIREKYSNENNFIKWYSYILLCLILRVREVFDSFSLINHTPLDASSTCYHEI